MKKSRLLIAVLAAIMFVLSACCLVACDKDAGDIMGGTTGGGGGGGGNNTTTSYTVTFNYNGGSGTPASATTTNGKLSSLPTPTTAPTGKKFDAWYDAATGGNKIALSKVYTANTTIFAQYIDNGSTPDPNPNPNPDPNPNPNPNPDPNPNPQPESDGELLVGGQRKMYLTDNTANIVAPAEGAKATYEYYATGVQLNAGDVVTFRIKGVVLAHHATPSAGARLWDTDTRHGVAFNQAAGTFTVKSNSLGVFTIYARYYDTDAEGSTDNPLNADHPCWSIEFTDGGSDTLYVGGAYLAGAGFANAAWGCTVENYIDPDDGLTVTLKQGDSFKVVTCGSTSGNGSPSYWNDSSKYEERGGSYLNLSSIKDGYGGDGGVKSGTHTYKITLEGDKVIFTLVS